MTDGKNGLDTTEDIPMQNEKAPVRIFFSLVYLRKRNNVTQTELAEKLGISRSLLALIETGRRKPNPQLLHKIAEIFDCDIAALDIEPATVEMAKQMIAEDVASLYNGDGQLCLSKEDRSFLLQVIRTLTPQLLLEEKVTTQTDESGNRIKERAIRKLAQYQSARKESMMSKL